MKLIIILVSICFVSCQTTNNLKLDDTNVVKYQYLEEDLDIAWKKVSSFKYKKETENYWKSPKELELDGFGDCEEFSSYLVYHLGKSSSCIAVRFYGESINHVIVKYKEMYIEPQVYGKYYYDLSKFKFIAYKSYDDTMKIATNFFTK